jgi:L-2,4-diaminobutyrate transaminase
MDAHVPTSLETMDRDSLIHPFTPLGPFARGETPDPRIMESGQGIRLRDTRGNELIDAFAGLYCVNVGYGRTEIADAIYAQAKTLAYCHSYAMQSHEPGIRLAAKILEWAPANMRRVFFGLSGSDANETQIKIAWYYHNALGKPGKKKIIARRRGYHGCSIMAGSLTGLPFYHTAFDMPTGPILHTTNPHHYWEAEPGMSEREFSAHCAKDLETLILAEGPDTVAAFIAEPMLGTGGLIPPPDGYWPAIKAVLDRYDVLFIADEVITGFGRMGTPFGCHFYDLQPDLITIAKGLTSAYLPLSAAIVGERVWSVLQKATDQFGAFSHGYTYTAHPTCAAAGLANLEIIEREDLMANVRETGAYFQRRLRETFQQNPFVGEVRGVNLLGAIEFVADADQKTRFDPALKIGARLSAACLEEGVIVRAMPHGDILGFAPPLVTTRDDVDEIIGRVDLAVTRVTAQLA